MCGFLTTADSRLLDALGLLAVTDQSTDINAHHQPVAQELADTSAQEDADDDVTVEVHGEQHDDVCTAKGHGMDKGPAQLLQRADAESHGLGTGDLGGTAGAALGGHGRTVGGGTAVELAEEEGVVLLAEAAEELDEDDEQQDANAGSDHHAVVGDVPRRGQEACIDGVPIPQHLQRPRLATAFGHQGWNGSI